MVPIDLTSKQCQSQEKNKTKKFSCLPYLSFIGVRIYLGCSRINKKDLSACTQLQKKLSTMYLYGFASLIMKWTLEHNTFERRNALWWNVTKQFPSWVLLRTVPLDNRQMHVWYKLRETLLAKYIIKLDPAILIRLHTKTWHWNSALFQMLNFN